MPSHVSLTALLKDSENTFGARVTDAFKSLLEEKHLYQTVTVNREGIPNEQLLAGLPAAPGSLSAPGSGISKKDMQSRARMDAQQINSRSWSIRTEQTRIRRPVFPGTDSDEKAPRDLAIVLPDVRLVCRRCESREPFNLTWGEELRASGSSRSKGSRRPRSRPVQVFALEYECQRCKATRDVFLVRREGLKVSLSGRSPIEVLELPNSIPDEVREYYRGALLAHQSGQTLPGNFLLRTTIEQWARRCTESRAKDASEVIDEYAESLPNDFKERFPSFRQLYRDLSADIHGARGDGTLFERARGDIEKHFDARKLYEL